MTALTYSAEETILVKRGLRLVSKPRLCNAPNCQKVHAAKWEFQNGRERRYVGDDLQVGRDQLPLWVENELAKLGHLKFDQNVDELAAAIERAKGILTHSRSYFDGETSLALGDLFVLPTAAIKRLAGGKPTLLVAVPTYGGDQKRTMLERIRDAFGDEPYTEMLAASVSLRSVPIPQSFSQPIVPGQHFLDERLALFVSAPAAKVLRALSKITAESVGEDVLAVRAERRRKVRPHRTFALTEPLVVVVNPADGANALLRLDKADGASIAVLNDHLAMPQVARSSLPVKLIASLRQRRF
jgi:hypothetical protein